MATSINLEVLELDAWRTLGGGVDLEAVIRGLGQLARSHAGIDELVIRSLDTESLRIDTIAPTTLSAPTIEIPAADVVRVHAVLTPNKPSVINDAVADERGQTLIRGHAPTSKTSSRRGCHAMLLRIPSFTTRSAIVVASYPSGGGGSDDDVIEATLARIAEPLALAVENHWRLQTLVHVNEAFLADRHALLQRLQRQDITEAIIGGNVGLRDVMNRVDRVAPTPVPVLLLGETGSGKEVIARAIHARSRRATGPILRVNCGAVSPELVDSELFGHERGSFTGATAVRKGWFERADGGTLFLDEIGELSMGAQVRLLRVLQDGTLERVGAERTLRVDVRVVAATHRDLRAMVAAGTFREDLWFRISTFVVQIPALRHRTHDIRPLAEHFAKQAGLRLVGVPLTVSDADVDCLVRYRWPGNVRELAAVIERAAILGSGRRLEVSVALGDAASEMRPHTIPPPPDKSSGDGGVVVTLDVAMARHITEALMRANGKIEGTSGAAAALGINPHTLRARMRKLRVDWPAFRRSSGRM